MDAVLVGLIRSDSTNKILGYQIMDIDTDKMGYLTVDEAKASLANNRKIRYLGLQGGKVILTGPPEENFTWVYKNHTKNVKSIIVKERKGIYVLATPDENGKKLGASSIDRSSLVIDESKVPDSERAVIEKNGGFKRYVDELVKGYNENIGNARFTCKNNGNGVWEISVHGNFPKESATVKQKAAEHEKKQGVDAKKEMMLRKFSGMMDFPIRKKVGVDGESHLHDIDESCGMTVEEKLLFTKQSLRVTKPFLFATLCQLTVEEGDPRESTAYATPDTLGFCSEFVKNCSFAELYFVHVHE